MTPKTLALPLLLSLSLVACGSDEAPPEPVTPAAPPPAPAPTAATPPKRSLVEGKLLANSPQNMLLDPGFVLTEQGEGGAGSFVAYYSSGNQRLTVKIRNDSSSPSGFGGGFAILKDPKATDTTSRSFQLLSSFVGGKGPFAARVWVSFTDGAGLPKAAPEENSGFSASLVDNRERNAAELVNDPEATKVANGRTWHLYKGEQAKDLVGGGLFLISYGSKGGGIELAAPEVVPVALTRAALAHPDARVETSAPALRERPLTTEERGSIAKYRSIPPRLMAAAPPALGEGPLRPVLGGKKR